MITSFGISVNTYRKFIVPRSHGWRMVLRAVECPHRARRAVDRSEAFLPQPQGSSLRRPVLWIHAYSLRIVFAYIHLRKKSESGSVVHGASVEVAKRIRKWARTRRVMVRKTLCDLPHMPAEMIRIIAAFAY